jgi:hypothetical protein
MNKEEAIDLIKAECITQGFTLSKQIAYVLATVEWETGCTFQPVREVYWKSEAWRRYRPGNYSNRNNPDKW